MPRVLAAVVVALLASTLRVPEALAADPDPAPTTETLIDMGELHLPDTAPYDDPSTLTLTMNPTELIGSLDAHLGDQMIPPQCVIAPGTDLTSVEDFAQYCIGSGYEISYDGAGVPTGYVKSTPPLTIMNGSNGWFRPDIGWLEQEAVDGIMVKHGITDPQIVRAYYAGDIRAAIQARLGSIVNMKLYGEPMTAEESRTFDDLESFLEQRELALARNIVEEYEQWRKNPCTYVVPAPPAVTAATPYVPNPYPDGGKCRSVAALDMNNVWSFTDGTPDLGTFATWAKYRNPPPVFKYLNSPEYKKAALATTYGVVNIYGFLSAVVGGAGIGTLVGVAKPLSRAIGNSLFPFIRDYFNGGNNPATKVVGAVTRGAGASRAALIAVFLAAVAVGLGIWSIIEEQKTVQSLYTNLQDAQRDSDPLGVLANAHLYAGLDYDTLEQPDPKPDLPQFRADWKGLLEGVVSDWTQFDEHGDLIPDANSGFDDIAHTAADPLFRTSGGQEVSTVSFAADDETALGADVTGGEVYVSRGNLMVDSKVDGYFENVSRPTPSLRYVMPSGREASLQILNLDPDTSSGPLPPRRTFQITEFGDGRRAPYLSDTWDVRTLGGAAESYTLTDTYALYQDLQVVPTMAGVQLPDQPLDFRAQVSDGHPDDLEYSWRFDRLGEDGEVLASQTDTGPSVRRFFSVPGTYRASAYIRKDGLTPDPLSGGFIDFTIKTPRPVVKTAELVDDRTVAGGQLFLDTEINQLTGDDDLTVKIDWADDLHGHTVSRVYHVDCVGLGAVPTCTTEPFSGTGQTPSNPNWSAVPVFTVPDDAAYLPIVTMTVTNSWGASETRTFRINGEQRARYDDRTPYVKMVVGKYSEVPITRVTPSPALDDPIIAIDDVKDQIVPQLPPGLQPAVSGPDADGKYTISVTGRPETADIGTTAFYFPVDQLERVGDVHVSVPESRPAPAQVLLDVVASTTPGFRGIIGNVPTSTTLSYFRKAEPPWSVQVAYSRPDGASVDDDPAFTGTVICDLFNQERNRSVDGFPRTCPQNEPFPFPRGMEDASYTASVQALPTGPGPDVDTTPYTKSFVVRFVRPTLTRDRPQPGATSDTVRLAIEDLVGNPTTGRVQPPFSASRYRVSCRYDGAAMRTPCLDTGVMELPRTPGRHRLDVRVIAPDGVRVFRRLLWTVRAATS